MKYLIAIHRPDDYDATSENEEMHRDIDTLNDEMVAAGVRIFVGGLQPVSKANSIFRDKDGTVTVEDGPYLKSGEQVGGFWVIEADNIDKALEWGRKAERACRASVEVRQFN